MDAPASPVVPLLRAPSRRGNDVAVSLRAPSGCPRTADRMAGEALRSGCPKPVALKVRDCVLHSGRYDCYVSFLVIEPFHLDGMRERMARFGGSVLVLDERGEEVR